MLGFYLWVAELAEAVNEFGIGLREYTSLRPVLHCLGHYGSLELSAFKDWHLGVVPDFLLPTEQNPHSPGEFWLWALREPESSREILKDSMRHELSFRFEFGQHHVENLDPNKSAEHICEYLRNFPRQNSEENRREGSLDGSSWESTIKWMNSFLGVCKSKRLQAGMLLRTVPSQAECNATILAESIQKPSESLSLEIPLHLLRELAAAIDYFHLESCDIRQWQNLVLQGFGLFKDVENATVLRVNGDTWSAQVQSAFCAASGRYGYTKKLFLEFSSAQDALSTLSKLSPICAD